MRCTAEFAKEAMAEQSLDNDEQVNIRWAYDDPNPRAQAARLRNNARLMLDAMERRGDLHDPNDEPYAKRQRGDGDGDDGDGDGDDAAAAAAPMTREEAEAREFEEQRKRAWEEAQADEAERELAATEAAVRAESAVASNVSRLDALLDGIGGGGGDDDAAIGGRRRRRGGRRSREHRVRGRRARRPRAAARRGLSRGCRRAGSSTRDERADPYFVNLREILDETTWARPV